MAALNVADIEKIEDEDELESMINKTEDLEIRRKIRKRQSAIREKRLAAFEAQRKERTEKGEDAIAMRLRMAEEDKQRKLKEMSAMAVKDKDKVGAGEQALRLKLAKADEEKQRKIDQMKDVGKTMSSAYNTRSVEIMKDKLPGASSSTVTTTKTVTTKTTSGGLGGGACYGSKTTTTVETSGGAAGGGLAAPKPNITRNPSAIKQMLLDWCKAQCTGYDNVNITNFSTSWNDGMAFCALIHHFYPESFDFAKLNPKNRRGNFTLAFDLAEKLADIAPLLEVDDMVKMKNPDWKCVFTYVQSFYRRFAMQPKQPTSP